LLSYILKRVLQSLFMLIAVSAIIYGLIKLMPGDPFQMYLDNPSASPAAIAKVREKYRLDDPIVLQYFTWVKNTASGDWGVSYNSQRPVMELIKIKFGATIQLSSFALFLALIVGMPMGVISSIKKNSKLDYTTTALSYLGISMPVFWFGLMLQLLFSVFLGWLPSAGRISTGASSGSFTDLLSHMIMPGLVLSLIYIASWSRYMRNNYTEVLNQDYIRTAKAKGLSDFQIYGIHALRNAIIPLLTIIALDLPALFAGAVVTETIFSWPGLGFFFITSLNMRDYPVLMGILLINALLVIVCNLIADLVYVLFDPRIKY
jgi:peptide/nickel transport system permease protein